MSAAPAVEDKSEAKASASNIRMTVISPATKRSRGRAAYPLVYVGRHVRLPAGQASGSAFSLTIVSTS